jgi:predicted PurR-regulated permease PerM
MASTGEDMRAPVRPRPRAPATPGGIVHARLLVHENPAIVTAWCMLLLAVVATAAAFYVARAYLLPIVAGFVLSVLLSPLVTTLENRGAPRALASAGVVFALCGLFYMMIALVAQPATEWVSNSPALIESAREHVERVQATLDTVEEISDEVGQLTGDDEASGREVVVQGPGLTQALATSARRITVQALFTLVMTYFFLISRNEIRLKAIAAHPRLVGRLHVARAFRDVEKGVAVYMVTVTLVNIGMGIVVAIAMAALGLPSPIMWGGIAGLLNFVPYVGPALTTILLGGAGLATFDTLAGAAAPALVFIAVNFFESNLVTPLLISKRMTLNPLAVLLAVSFWTWIWGPVGGLLSIPMLIMLKVVCEQTAVARPIGAFIGGPLQRPARRGPLGLRPGAA